MPACSFVVYVIVVTVVIIWMTSDVGSRFKPGLGEF